VALIQISNYTVNFLKAIGAVQRELLLLLNCALFKGAVVAALFKGQHLLYAQDDSLYRRRRHPDVAARKSF
jgi:hypothetical protein